MHRYGSRPRLITVGAPARPKGLADVVFTLMNAVVAQYQQCRSARRRSQTSMQGRLLHINDGANAPWKKQGERFCRNLGGRREEGKGGGRRRGGGNLLQGVRGDRRPCLYVQSIVQKQILVITQNQNKLINCQLNFTTSSGQQYIGFPIVSNILVRPKFIKTF